ncbi:hypothetical protein DRP05_10755 [Archaeoglobales archaeon]|nr:MAG: hypothetical protein DRP05_10755 [Archaeoglobales archaeon]
MFDRETKAMLILGLLNDAYGDVRTMIHYLNDFRLSHPEMKEVKEFGLDGVVDKAIELQNNILKAMEKN